MQVFSKRSCISNLSKREPEICLRGAFGTETGWGIQRICFFAFYILTVYFQAIECTAQNL
jgi:hypothetical protein